ncbi:MAG: hypothetical protein ACI4IJ_09170 [Acutalibacteraceae bacterium]
MKCFLIIYVKEVVTETLIKPIHTPLSDRFSRRGIDGYAFNQRILNNSMSYDDYDMHILIKTH